MAFQTPVTDSQVLGPPSARESQVLNHLLRRNLISQMDDFLTENPTSKTTDLLTHIQSQNRDHFRQVLIEQMTEKENRQRAEQQRQFEKLRRDEERLQKQSRSSATPGPVRKEGSLIINGNKILNETRQINDVLNEMKNAQKVSLIDLVLTEKETSRPIPAKPSRPESKYLITRPLDGPILHNDSRGFAWEPRNAKGVPMLDFSKVFAETGTARSTSENVYHPRFDLNAGLGVGAGVGAAEVQTLDCSDVYAMIESQMRRNRLLFNSRKN